MVRAMVLAAAGALAWPGQDGGAAGERIVLADRLELRGEIVEVDPAGTLKVRLPGGERRAIPVEEVRRVRFQPEGNVGFDPAAERVRLFHGGLLSGKIRAVEGEEVVVETPAGAWRLPRSHVRSLALGPLTAPFPEVPESGEDLLVRELARVPGDPPDTPSVRAVAETGRLVRLGEKEAVVRSGGEERSFPRGTIRQVHFHHEEPPDDLPPGWYVRVLLRNGDRLTGVLGGAGAERVRLFSHLAGTVELDKRHLQAIFFVPQVAAGLGNLLVCDQSGLKELDRRGRVVWSWSRNVQGAWAARKLDNGNILLANTPRNQILEIRPVGPDGAEVVWEIPHSNHPYDAVRLENGNVLAAEYSANRVVEYDYRTRAPVWECRAIPYPISIQRLDNGHTLIGSNQGIVEVDAEGRERWRPSLRGVRPWRAHRLENGNTLVVDFQRGQVVEIDPQSSEVWRMENLSRPAQALRLDDGNTLILEQGQNRIVEVDPSGRIVRTFRDLESPQAMSVH